MRNAECGVGSGEWGVGVVLGGVGGEGRRGLGDEGADVGRLSGGGRDGWCRGGIDDVGR